MLYLQLHNCCEPLISPFGSPYSPFLLLLLFIFASNIQKERASSLNSWISDGIFSLTGPIFFINIGNCYLILLNIGILALPVYTLEFFSYSSKRWNSCPVVINVWISGPIFLNIGILILSVHHWIFYNYNPSTTNIVILVLSLYTLEFLPYSSKHCNTYLILALQTWKFWPHPSKHWNSGPVLINEVVVTFSLQTLEFWPNFYTLWLSYHILQNIEILALFLQALELWSYLGNVRILALFLYSLVFLSYPCS